VRYWVSSILMLVLYACIAVLIGIALAYGAELRRGEADLLARVVQAEGTGEPEAGARAIAWTVMNRLREPETYGSTITEVLQRPYQYAAPAPVSSSTAYLRAMLATAKVLLGAVPDDSKDSTHFARCDVRPRPVWMRTFELRARHGVHCFFRRRG
jgi:spore germination cell wall hydrolase CwlJ-like protein